jgi:dynein heavy chain, axonemal
LQVVTEEGPPTERSFPTAVMIGDELLAFGGDCAGEPIQEVCCADMSNLTAPLAWREPNVASGPHTLPRARKGMSAFAKGGQVFMAFGLVMNDKHEYEASSEMFTLKKIDDKYFVGPIEQHGLHKPVPRAAPLLQDFSPTAFFMFGGMTADNKPLNDGWIFDIKSLSWSCIFNGHSDLALPSGALCCLHGKQLVALNAGTGSPKLDSVASLDFQAVKSEYEFVHKMKTQGQELLSALQAWTDKQSRGLLNEVVDGDFSKLLETMGALYEIREARDTKELLIDQLHELFTDLAGHKINTKKGLEQLQSVRIQLEAVKKSAPAVKEALGPVQAKEGKRIRNEMQDYTDNVNKHARDFRKFPFFIFSTGPDASYTAIDTEV